MILSRLLSELAHLGVRLKETDGRLKVHAPAGALTEDLRQTISEQKSVLLQFAAYPYVETVDGLGVLSGNTQQRDLYLVPEERQEALRYRIGVVSLRDGIERFCYPRMVLLARPETIQAAEPSHEVLS